LLKKSAFFFWFADTTFIFAPNYSLFADRQKSATFASKFIIMRNYRQLITDYGFDLAAWKGYYRQHQIAYIRQRLWVVRHFSEGMSSSKVALEMGISAAKVYRDIEKYLSGGFAGLVARDTRCQPKLLSASQEAAFKNAVQHTRPIEHGIDSHIWTGKVMIEYLQTKYNVTYKSGIYDLLARLGLTHQRAHADYSNADPEKQRVFGEQLTQTLLNTEETTAVLFSDEFSVSEKPSAYYAWAEKNTRPKYSTNEKKTDD
jgi:transposase